MGTLKHAFYGELKKIMLWLSWNTQPDCHEIPNLIVMKYPAYLFHWFKLTTPFNRHYTMLLFIR